MPALVAAWRAAWSATPGTTDPLAPFGICTLSTDDSEGAGDIASFRWSQGGNYGVAPNPVLPNVFLAHGHDLADVWVNCGGHPQTMACPGCDTADPEYNCLQQWYMGPGIHPRLKKPFGQRLAASALVSVYGWPGPVTGPTLAGCTLVSGGSSTAPTLTLTFNATLLAGSTLALSPGYNHSGLSILVNSTLGVPGTGKWVEVGMSLVGGGGGSNPPSIAVDLTAVQGSPQAIKYAWGKTGGAPDSDGDVWCCAVGNAPGLCLPGGCPIFAVGQGTSTSPFGGMAANPFLAQITPGGKCLCPIPQVCDQ